MNFWPQKWTFAPIYRKIPTEKGNALFRLGSCKMVPKTYPGSVSAHLNGRSIIRPYMNFLAGKIDICTNLW